jgi:hypothetical protein
VLHLILFYWNEKSTDYHSESADRLTSRLAEH